MNNAKVGMLVVLIGWFIGVIDPISNWISFIAEKIDLNSGHEMTQAEIVLDEADFEEMFGYKKVTLKYTANDELIENVMSKEEYINNGYSPFVNGGLINVIYEIENPNAIRTVANKRLIPSAIRLVLLTMITVYIFKKIYPEAIRRQNKEYRNQKYVDAKILSSDSLNRVVAMDDTGDKIRIFKSFPFFNETNNMSVFLKSKNIEKIRVYFDDKNEKKIVMDYQVLSEVKSDD